MTSPFIYLQMKSAESFKLVMGVWFVYALGNGKNICS